MESVHKGLGVLSVVIASTVVAINLLGTDANSQSIVTDDEAKNEKSEAIVKSVEAKTMLTEASETEVVAEQTGVSVNEDVKKAPPGLYFVPSFPSIEELSTKEKEGSKEEAPKEEVSKEEAPKEEASKEEASKEEPKEEAPKEEVSKEEASKEEASKEEAPKEEVSKEEASKEEAPKEEVSKEEASKEEVSKGKASEAQKKNTVLVVMDENGEPQAIFPDMPDEGESLEWANVETQKKSLEKQEPSLNIVPSMPPQWMQKEPTGVPQPVGGMKPTQQPGAQYYQPTNQMPMMPYPYMMPYGVNPYYQYVPRVMYVPVYQYRRAAGAMNQALKVQASSRADAITPKQKSSE